MAVLDRRGSCFPLYLESRYKGASHSGLQFLNWDRKKRMRGKHSFRFGQQISATCRNCLTASRFKRRYQCLIAVENVGSALCCPRRGEVLLSTEQCQATGSSWGACSPSPPCCAVHACGNCECIMTEIKVQGEQLSMAGLGWTSPLGKSSPGLVLQQCTVYICFITFIGTGQPLTSSLLGMPWPCKFQKNAYIAMTRNVSFNLAGPYSLLQEKKQKQPKNPSTYIAPDNHFSNQIFGKKTLQHLQIVQWFSIPAIRKLFPTNDS